MSYVHTSVNNISRDYLANDRRYNYTTPKSFLEQISLYSKLITNKSEDLLEKIIRLAIDFFPAQGENANHYSKIVKYALIKIIF